MMSEPEPRVLGEQCPCAILVKDADAAYTKVRVRVRVCARVCVCARARRGRYLRFETNELV